MYNKLIMVAACVVMANPATAGTIATFDWEEHSGNWWVNYGLSEVDNGVTLQAGGQAAALDGGDGAGGFNGTGFKAAYQQDATDGTYVCQVGGVDQLFEVLSIDVMGDAGNSGMPAGDLLIIGTLGGVPQWTIDPTEAHTFYTYTTATTGDMTIRVDQIVWQAPYDPASTQLVWNNKIDNLVIFLGPFVTTTNNSDAGSLRNIIAGASSGDTIKFVRALNGQTISLSSGQLLVDKNLTIDASNLPDGIIIDGNGSSRIFEFASGTTNVLTGLTLTNGYASSGGAGAIKVQSGAVLTISNATISGNSVYHSDGGGIFNYGTLTLNSVTLSGNSADYNGGGIYNSDSGTLKVYNVTLNGNSAAKGGGIHNYLGPLIVNSSTLSGNSADTSGGGIYNFLGAHALTNTIVAGNTAPTDANISNISGSFSDHNNLTSGDPLLAPLGDYGGPTQTMPPLLGSPAIDAGGSTMLALDQRGYPRIINGTADIGACEAFHITESHHSTSGFTLEWMTPPAGWTAWVLYSTNLVDMPFTKITYHSSWTNYTDTVHAAEGQCFYRVELVP